MGVAFDGQRMLNEADAGKLPFYKRIVANPSYRGVMVVPVTFGSTPLGTLAVDRTGALASPAETVSVFRALADVIAIASHVYGEPRGDVSSMNPSPMEHTIGDDTGEGASSPDGQGEA